MRSKGLGLGVAEADGKVEEDANGAGLLEGGGGDTDANGQ